MVRFRMEAQDEVVDEVSGRWQRGQEPPSRNQAAVTAREIESGKSAEEGSIGAAP